MWQAGDRCPNGWPPVVFGESHCSHRIMAKPASVRAGAMLDVREPWQRALATVVVARALCLLRRADYELAGRPVLTVSSSPIAATRRLIGAASSSSRPAR